MILATDNTDQKSENLETWKPRIMDKLKLFWLQALIVLTIIVGQALDRSIVANDLGVATSLAIMLVVLNILGRPSETIAEMRLKVFNSGSKIKVFLLTYLLPIYMTVMMASTALFSRL